MGDESPDALTLVVFALDEMRETTSLIPIEDISRSFRRSWWRKIFFMFARSRAEVGAGMAAQYLSENIDRARDHWREALSRLDDLERLHGGDAVMANLIEELSAAGVASVLPALQDDAIPRPMSKAAEHLAGVVERIRYCDTIAQDARKKLELQRLRNRQT